MHLIRRLPSYATARALSRSSTAAAAARPVRAVTTTTTTANGIHDKVDAVTANTSAALPSTSSSPSSSSSISPSPSRLSPRPAFPPRPLMNLLGMSLLTLETELIAQSIPRYRAKQLIDWIYNHGTDDIAKIDNFNPELKKRLGNLFSIQYGQVVDQQISQKDWTRKFIIGLKSAKSKLVIPTVPVSASSSAGATAATTTTSIVDSFPLDHIECVYIPMGKPSSYSTSSDGGTICVSSQIGCSLNCTFCHTGTMSKTKLRNLLTAEIIGQIMIVKHALGDFNKSTMPTTTKSTMNSNTISSSPSIAPPSPPPRSVTSIVFMGMGEPLYNYRHVRGALDILTSSPRAGNIGFGFSVNRITVSTSGVVPGIDALLEDFGGNVNLAISLHACRDSLRDQIVPINKTFPIGVLMEAVRRYQNGRIVNAASSSSGGGGEEDDAAAGGGGSVIIAGRKRVTFEYVMLSGINDDLSEALALSRLLHGIVSLVNLIPFNPWEGSSYISSKPEHIILFAQELTKLGIPTTIRWPRGRDIQGACGQLAIKHQTAAATAAATNATATKMRSN